MIDMCLKQLICIPAATLAGCQSYRMCEKEGWTEETETVYLIDSSSVNETPPADFVPTEEPPKFLYFARPTYPSEILSTVHDKYKMWALMWIGTNGTVRQMRMRKCEPQQLIPFVIEAVKAMRLIPAKTNGIPLDVWVSVPFVYPE